MKTGEVLVLIFMKSSNVSKTTYLYGNILSKRIFGTFVGLVITILHIYIHTYITSPAMSQIYLFYIINNHVGVCLYFMLLLLYSLFKTKTVEARAKHCHVIILVIFSLQLCVFMTKLRRVKWITILNQRCSFV